MGPAGTVVSVNVGTARRVTVVGRVLGGGSGDDRLRAALRSRFQASGWS